MHSRIASAMPELNPPSFECFEVESKHLRIHYFSDREGFAPMVVGLLEGVGEMFNVQIEVLNLNTKAHKGFDSFDVQYR